MGPIMATAWGSVACSLSPPFLTSLPYLPLFLITLSSALTPLFHRYLPHESCSWAAPSFLSPPPTSVFLSAWLQFSISPQPGFSFTTHPALSWADYYAVSSRYGAAHTIHHNVQILSAQIQ